MSGDTECNGDAVIPFTKETWETARLIAQARKQHQKRSKYLVICESVNFEVEPLLVFTVQVYGLSDRVKGKENLF